MFWNLYWVYIYVTLSINSLWQYSFVIFLILFSSLNRMARVLSFIHLSKNLFWFCRSFYCMFTIFINFWVYLNFFLPSIFLVFILLPFFSLLELNALLINLPPLFFSQRKPSDSIVFLLFDCLTQVFIRSAFIVVQF